MSILLLSKQFELGILARHKGSWMESGRKEQLSRTHAHAETKASENSEAEPRGANTHKGNSMGKSWCWPNWKGIKFKRSLTKP